MKILEWMRRHAAAGAPTDHALAQLRTRGSAEVARATGLPTVWMEGIRSFYDQLHVSATAASCTGTACHFAGDRAPAAEGVHCYGRCYEAPVRGGGVAGPIPRASLVEEPVVLRHLLGEADDRFRDYDLPPSGEILHAVAASGLRGRGGAAFPTAAKWRVARDTPAPERFVVANGDEGDPGAYIDRLLLEESPHAVLAGMLACARAIGARKGIVFIRGEYPEARRRMLTAVEEATAAGCLPGLSVSVIAGAGSYVAGEESALLRAIEGLRAEPSPKPPYPAERGLYGMPTVVQNVETLSIIPWIVQTHRRSDTKAMCLSGAVGRPGVVEVALGTTLAEVLARGGHGPRGPAAWKMALVGGPMGRVVPARDFATTALDFERLPGMGHGGVVVLDETVPAGALARHLYRFAVSESCGTCTPCRVGCAQLESRRDRTSLERLLETLEMGSLCGFGQGVPRPIRDLIQHFPEELFAC
jgi:NADH:ubiquinone oxidoreductase subunit F (NADH-binding)